ncbi:MAG: ornithine carbamoyltransferase [Verrucomicrobiota bacterium]
MKHFLKVNDFSLDEAEAVFKTASAFKQQRFKTPACLEKQSWGMLFYKNSTRTRVSFEAGLFELGAHPLILSSSNTQLSRGESVADTARVLSRYLSGLIIRCYDHSVVEDFARYGSIPVVNALTDLLHPCQLYADLFTLCERWDDHGPMVDRLKGRKVAFLGDTASNMANSWILAAAHFGMELSLSGPAVYAPGEQVQALLQESGLEKTYTYTQDAAAAAAADVIYTDVWVSMGDEDEAGPRLEVMQPYQVNADLMAQAKPDACFMHCLPAHPGQEVTQEVLDSSASIIFEEAENRLHAQKAILTHLDEARHA